MTIENNRKLLLLKNEVNIINELLLVSFSYLKPYSEFLEKNIIKNWEEYSKCDSDTKCIRLLDNLYKTIDKLKSKEMKNECFDFSSYKDDLVKVYNSNIANYSVGKRLKKIMSSIKDNKLSYFIKLFIDEYSVRKKELLSEKNTEVLKMPILKKKNVTPKVAIEVEKLVLPKLYNDTKEEKIVNTKFDYAIVYNDKNEPFLYTHILNNNDNYIFSVDSFKKENKLFENSYKALNKDFYSNLKEKIKNKFSIYEIRRRSFVEEMHSYLTTVISLKAKQIDIVYPLDDFYKIARRIVDLMYDDLINSSYKNHYEDILLYFTRYKYGSLTLLKEYNSLVIDFLEKLDGTDKLVQNELLTFSYSLKNRNDNKMFRKSLYVVPTYDDVLSALNARIIDDVSNNIIKFKSKLKTHLFMYTKYMTVNDILKLYNKIKIAYKKLEVPDFQSYIDLQRMFCDLVYLRIGLVVEDKNLYIKELKRICSDIFREQELFSVKYNKLSINDDFIVDMFTSKYNVY